MLPRIVSGSAPHYMMGCPRGHPSLHLNLLPLDPLIARKELCLRHVMAEGAQASSPAQPPSPVPRQALPMQEVPEQPQPHRTREFHIQLLFLFIQTGGQLLL